MALANVNLKFGLNITDFTSKMEKVEKSVSRFGKNLTNIGSKLTVGVTLPIVAIGAASLKMASDWEETASKFDTVFRDIKGGAEESFQTLRNEYGLSSLAAKQMLGDTGDLLTGFGFSQTAALELSTEVGKLAVDLASFTNYSGGAAGASQVLTKALLGERDGLKALGIAIMEEDVKKQVAINTAKGMTFETERQAKAHATLELAIKQSGNAIGDYARTSESFANQSRLLRARLEDISIQIGVVFLPLATKLVSALGSVVSWFSNLSDSTKRVIVIIGGLAAAIGPLMVGLGFLMTTVLPMLKAGFLAMGAVMSPLVLKIAAVTAVVGGLVLVGKAVYDSWGTVSEFFSQMWDKVKIMFINGVAATLKAFNKFTSIIGLDFSDTILKMEKDASRMQTALDAKPVVTLGDAFSEIGKNIIGTFTSVKDSIVSNMEASETAIQKTATATAGIGGGGINRTTEVAIQGPSRDPITDLAMGMKEKMGSVSLAIRENAPVVWEAAQQLTEEFGYIITGGISNGITMMASSIGGALASGADVISSLGTVLLQAIGTIATELGKASIAIGVGMIAIKKAFSNPFTAIAAGIALVALGSFISTKVANIPSGGGGGAMGPMESVQGQRAMGGTVQMNKPYLVGERGPELFTPSGFGNITPNNKMGGGQTIENHIIIEVEGRQIAHALNRFNTLQGRST